MRIDIVFFKDSHAIANTFPIRVLFWSTIILLLCTGPVASVNVTLSNGSIATQGESTVLHLTLDKAPDGLAGYFVNLTVDDPRIVRITGIEFPGWAGLHSTYGLDEGKDVQIAAIDVSKKVQSGSTDIPLANVTVQGLINGSTKIHLNNEIVDSDTNGHIFPRTLIDGNVNVGAFSPDSDAAPITSFEGSPASGVWPLKVTFTDTSTRMPTMWSWSFGDGSYSTERNPAHTYITEGTFPVSLIAANAEGSNTTTVAGYIAVRTGVIQFPGSSHLPVDHDHDGLCEDLNGDGLITFADVQLFFYQLDWMRANEPVAAFDFNGNGNLEFDDIVHLNHEV